MIQIESKIISNEQIGPAYWKMTLEAPQIASEAMPGQFVHARIDGTLLRRPFSIFRCVNSGPDSGTVEMVYRVVGRGTRLMTTLRPEEMLDIIGPLGHGFHWESTSKTHVLVAGGTGSAGLFMLGEEISRAAGKSGCELFIFLGAVTKAHLILEKAFKTLDGKVMISTDDGSYGHKGLVTEALAHAIQEENIPADCVIYASGPQPMLKSLAVLCQRYHIDAQVSLEKRMLCGIGACAACVCRVDKDGVLKHRNIDHSGIQFDMQEAYGYGLVCKDGPVFHIEEVVFDE
ncbi:MAG: dihydroorotate dehydrogenase electron transfer subunit [Deltaproteobacteria bacterium]|nr:dihydroorotate dehydrogenase electron transfer subunit [Deltaproteobacteria bacterium]